MIELRNVSKDYKVKKGKKVTALNNISIKFPNKGMVFITGKSGSGKSTLLNLLGLLDKPSSGEILINNKLTSKFKDKEIDYYRNTYIGFVFQEYNLLENFNVYKNIEIALDLQRKKCDKSKVNDILNIVGLTNLGQRKVNELSGGQKQRVAIGRAIVKNTSLILADEPTGNLDEENSKQIFNILKNISNQQLVIVVTHDTELAKLYADRIIEIEDGKIKQDIIIKEENYDFDDIKLIKSKLPILKSLEFSLYNLNMKKLRLFVMIFLTTIAFSVFGFFASLVKFDINRTHAETMVVQNESRVSINKKIIGKNYTSASPLITFTDLEVDEITRKLERDVIKVSKAVENNAYLSFNFAPYNSKQNIEKKSYSYYDIYPDYTLFLEYSNQNLKSLNIIGELPDDANEVIISKVLADYIIEKGILIYNLDDKNNYVENNFYPNDYNELVSSKAKVVFGSNYLIITGIIDEDMTRYDSLKKILSKEMELNKTKLYEEFIVKYSKVLNEVIVNDSFFETFELKSNTVLPSDFYKEVYLYEGRRIYTNASASLLTKKIDVFNGKEVVKVDKILDNQVIITTSMLDSLYDNEYSNNFYNYWDELQKDYEKRIKEREKRIKEIDEIKLKNPDAIIDYPKEIEELNYKEELDKFTINYVLDKGIIGKHISLEINDLYLRTQNEQKRVIKDIEIIGIDLSGVYTFFSNELLSEYMRSNDETISIYFDEYSVSELEKIFNEFSGDDSTFVAETVFTPTIISVQSVVKEISHIAQFFACGFLIFSIIIFIYFIISSINQNKKSIGVLRALGARVTDIYKIFYLESFIIGMSSFILSSFIIYFVCIIANNSISNNLFLNIKPIIFRIDLIYQMFIFIILLITISFVMPVFKISKSKPIDIINKL